MPYKTFGCRICGEQAPRKLREHGTMGERQEWLWHHRKQKHPKEFKKSVQKSIATKRANQRKYK